MEERILKAIQKHFYSVSGTPEKSAKEITEHVFKFVEWYSGMERQKIINAYNRYLKEHSKE